VVSDSGAEPVNVFSVRRPRQGAAALEVVLTTAVVLPLAALMFFLGVEICQYVHRGFDGMLTMPWL